ncbi:arginyltransferase [Shewanella gelidii]|uniref:Aspartate/glutamate leucyltransferase n=1 Tax=Shewanella gelidii TaxID=1642821 RepID=A0A917NCM2_9GAMM|nr:arginyltransferase [Shewanella gelidii]MCL1099011.1 arginyltransferase [Shewanella gelidii]GGI88867.1 putative arginyl-tRNA--protein transferase [Shewanella gelidii]
MNSDPHTIAIGISKASTCVYKPEKQEQLLVIQEEQLDISLFERLLALGFRRSGDAMYKPRCAGCQACLPIRIPIADFSPSKRQKRTLKNNLDIHWQVTEQYNEKHYQLYAQYIAERHMDGPMYPPTPEQYQNFLLCRWLQPLFIELYHEQELIGVAVTDHSSNCFSAIYSYFSPKLAKRSLGALMILIQIEVAKQMGKQYLYLGYQIDDNRKMNYKRLYRPYEILSATGWQYYENP